jgi:hypothetical protein
MHGATAFQTASQAHCPWREGHVVFKIACGANMTKPYTLALAAAAAFQFIASLSCAHSQPAPPPGSPAANFFDDSLLAQAGKEIITFASRRELDLMTDLLATCEVYGLDDNDERFNQCTIAFARHKIGFDDGRAVDKILFATHLSYRRLRLGARVRGGEIQELQRTHIPRIVKVSQWLASHISQRNRDLSRQP